MINTVICPHCKQNIELTEALTHQIQEEAKADFDKKIEEVKRQTLEKAQKEMEEKHKLEVLDFQKANEEKDKKINEFRENELILREKTRNLEEKAKELDLEVARRVDEEKKKFEEQVIKQSAEEHRLKDLEKEKKMADMEKLIEELKRKSQQGSQQMQGEVLELDLEEMLKNSFPEDSIEPVGKGVRGADIRQIVKTKIGNVCGVILWETKRTKDWKDEWLAKLKADLRAEKANAPVIVTAALPREAESGLGFKDGVWICSFALVFPLAEILRQELREIAKAKYVLENRDKAKAEDIYDYITGHEFRQHIEAMVEVYRDMNDQVLRERAAFEKIWKAREAQVNKLLRSASGIIGDLQGRIGNSTMIQIKGLETFELESGEK